MGQHRDMAVQRRPDRRLEGLTLEFSGPERLRWNEGLGPNVDSEMTVMDNEDPADPRVHERQDAYRCIAPACKPLGCSDCNCAVPADVYAALGRAFVEVERERCAKLCDDISERHLRSGRYVSVVADHAVRAGGQVDGADECARAIRGA